MLRYMTDRAFYDIQPGNRAGLFLQPRNPHGTDDTSDQLCMVPRH